MNIPIFSNEKVNLGRQKEIDYVKALATVVMIMIHTIAIGLFFQNNITYPYIYFFGML